MDGGDSHGAKAGRNWMEANNFSIYGMTEDRIGETRALLNGARIPKRERSFVRREVSLHRRNGVVGMSERNNPGLTMGIRERSIGDRRVAIDALAPRFGAVKFDYLGMLLDALKRSPGNNRLAPKKKDPCNPRVYVCDNEACSKHAS